MLKLILYIYIALTTSCFICLWTFFNSVKKSLEKTHNKKNSFCLPSAYIPVSFFISLIPIAHFTLLKELIFNYGNFFEAAYKKFEEAEEKES